MKSPGTIAAWSTLAAVVALIGWGFLPRPIDVDVRTVQRGPLSVSITEEGKTRVIDRFVVSAPVGGYARRVELDVGDAVRRGETLVHVDPARSTALDPRSEARAEAAVTAAQAALQATIEGAKAARAEAELARNEYERVRRVAADGLMSRGDLDSAQSRWRTTEARQRSAQFQVDVARGELAAAQAVLDYSAAAPWPGEAHRSVEVAAPVDGQVLAIIHESEGAVIEGQPLLEIGDPRALEVEVELLSADATRVRAGTAVRFHRWGGSEVLGGATRRIEPRGFTKISALGVEEQRVLVICDITSPFELWQALGDGYRVEAEFVLWERDDVLQIPASALFTSDGAPAVFELVDGRAIVTAVEVGARSGLAVQVLSGLDEGDAVIIYPGERVGDGTRVRPRA